MDFIVFLLIRLLDIYIWLVIVAVMVSWLAVLGVLNMRNRWAYKLSWLLNEATRPPIMFLRRYIPPVGGIDLSPMALVVLIYIVQHFLYSLLR